MEKKGAMGLDTAKVFVLMLLILAVVGFTLIIVMSSLQDTDLAVQKENAYPQNETTGNFTLVTTTDTLSTGIYESCTSTIETVYQESAVLLIDSPNYSVSGCIVSITAAGAEDANAANYTWNITYKSNYIKQNFGTEMSGNVSSGAWSFFANTGTWFSLLSVVIIILIIGVVIYAVNRFSGGGSGGGYSEGL